MIIGFDHISATLEEIGFRHRFLNDSTAVWVSQGGSSVVVSTTGDDEELECTLWVSDHSAETKGNHIEIAVWLQKNINRGLLPGF